MGRKGGRKYALKLLVNERVLELFGLERRNVQWDRETGILQRENPTFCSLGVQQEAIQSQPGHLHVQPPQNAKRCLNELKSHPTASGEIQIPGDSESPALPPAGAHGQLGAELQHSCWQSLGIAQEGKGFFLIVRKAGNSRGSFITFH